MQKACNTGILDGIWDLGADQPVDLLGGQDFERRIQCEQQMHVRKAALLKLDRIAIGRHFPKDLAFDDLLGELLALRLEHAASLVEAVLFRLIFRDVFGDFLPVRIAGEGDEEIRVAEFADHRNRILILLLQVARGVHKARRKNHQLSEIDLLRIVRLPEMPIGLGFQMIAQTLIGFNAQIGLMLAKPIEFVVLNFDRLHDRILLKETA